MLTLDDIHIVSTVGIGGFSQVFKAIDIRSGKLFALKKVKVFSRKEGLPISFYREVQTLRALEQQNLMKIHDIIVDDQYQIYLVLDYCEFDLFGLIHHPSHPKMDKNCFIWYSRQIFAAIREIHQQNYIHCDIKPSNILITRSNDVKVADFGLSRIKSNKKMPSNVATKAYRSPELVLGDQFYTFAVDVWALGCLLFEMAAGFRLFKQDVSCGKNHLISIFQITGSPTKSSSLYSKPLSEFLDEIPQFPSRLQQILIESVPKRFHGLSPIIEQMLSINPEQRPSINDIIEHPFFADCVRPHQLELPEFHAADCSHNMISSKRAKKSFSLPTLKLPLPPISVF